MLAASEQQMNERAVMNGFVNQTELDNDQFFLPVALFTSSPSFCVFLKCVFICESPFSAFD